MSLLEGGVDSPLGLRSVRVCSTLMSNDDSVLKHLCRASVFLETSGEIFPSVAVDNSRGFPSFIGMVCLSFGGLLLQIFASLGDLSSFTGLISG